MISFVDKTNDDEQNVRILTNCQIVETNCYENYELSNEITIITHSCTYRFTKHMFCFITLTNFSIILEINRFVFCVRHAKQCLFAIQHDFANDNEFIFRIKLKLRRIQKFSLRRTNFSKIRNMFYIFCLN